MAINLPTSRVVVPSTRFLRTRPILSGDAAGDHTYGMRGLSSQANHGFAYRVRHLVGDVARVEAEPILRTTSTSTIEYFRSGPIHFGAAVTTVGATFRFRNGTMILRANDGTSTFTEAGDTNVAYTTVTQSLTLTDTSGAVGWVGWQAAATAAQTLEVVYWAIYEVVLSAGEVNPETFEELILRAGEDGEEVTIDTGAVYVYVEAESSWLRKEVYDASDADLGVLAQIDGDVTPNSEVPDWVDNTSNGGTITSDGEWATWDSTAGATAYAYSEYNDGSDQGTPASGRFFEGYIRLNAIGSAENDVARCIVIENGERRIILNLHRIASSGARFVDDVNAVVGSGSGANILSAGAVYVEFLGPLSGGTCYVWIDHAADPVLTADPDDFNSSSVRETTIGDQGVTNAEMDLDGKDIKVWRVT